MKRAEGMENMRTSSDGRVLIVFGLVSWQGMLGLCMGRLSVVKFCKEQCTFFWQTKVNWMSAEEDNYRYRTTTIKS